MSDRETTNDSDNSYLSDNDDQSAEDFNEDHEEEIIIVKKKPIKTKKLALKEALKTVEERALYTKIDSFFMNDCDYTKILKMVAIIENENIISLRMLNWFAMKHSATMQPLEITNDEDSKVELFDVKISYRARLNTHSKKYFDPFRRGRKFDYHYDKTDKNKMVETTICQLNFFRWLLMHDLLDYVEEHFNELKNKMGSFNNVEKKKKEVKKEKEKEQNKLIKNKKEETKLKAKKFTEDKTDTLVIII